MTINVNNITDFITMITTCISNSINDIRVFISEKDSYPSVSTIGTPKNHVKFTYVLFTPLYTAIYSDNIKSEKYDSIYKSLEICQEQCKHDFRIQVFEDITYNSNNDTLIVEKQLNVI